MNLNNLNLVELTIQETKETDGGFLPLLILGACLLISGCAAKKAPVYNTNPN
ncbi:hypothetical protein D3C85_660770 [compost metagenome]